MSSKMLPLLAVLLASLWTATADHPAANEPGTFLLYTGGVIGRLDPCG